MRTRGLGWVGRVQLSWSQANPQQERDKDWGWDLLGPALLPSAPPGSSFAHMPLTTPHSPTFPPPAFRLP